MITPFAGKLEPIDRCRVTVGSKLAIGSGVAVIVGVQGRIPENAGIGSVVDENGKW